MNDSDDDSRDSSEDADVSYDAARLRALQRKLSLSSAGSGSDPGDGEQSTSGLLSFMLGESQEAEGATSEGTSEASDSAAPSISTPGTSLGSDDLSSAEASSRLEGSKAGSSQTSSDQQPSSSSSSSSKSKSSTLLALRRGDGQQQPRPLKHAHTDSELVLPQSDSPEDMLSGLRISSDIDWPQPEAVQSALAAPFFPVPDTFSTKYEFTTSPSAASRSPRPRMSSRKTYAGAHSKNFARSPDSPYAEAFATPRAEQQEDASDLLTHRRRSLLLALDAGLAGSVSPPGTPPTSAHSLRSPPLSRSSSIKPERHGSLQRRHSRQSSRSVQPAALARRGSASSTSSQRKRNAFSIMPNEFLEVLAEGKRRVASGESDPAAKTPAKPLVIDVRPLPDFLGSTGRIRGSMYVLCL